MSSDVVLGSALRSNLQSLQNTQDLIDKTQQRLATGKKVNSALDNAQSFFAAESLNNRASDLSRLLDGIGQSIRTIEGADKGIEALTSLVEQADSVAAQARDALADQAGASVASSKNTALSNNPSDPLADITGVDAGDTFTIETVDGGSQTFTISADTTAKSLVADINDRAAANSGFKAEASVNSDGQLSIRSSDGSELVLADTAGGESLRSLGFFKEGAGADGKETVLNGNTLKTELTGSGKIDAQTTLGELDNFAGLSAGDADSFDISVNGGTAESITINSGTTVDDFVDAINTGTNTTGLTANFDASTGELSIKADDSVESFSITVTEENGTDIAATGFGADLASGETQTYQPSSGSSTDTVANLQDDYNELRSQIDSLVSDASYAGVNLLKGDSLTTFFNEDRSSSLTTEGADFTSGGLGLSTADFSSSANVQASIDEARAALNKVRDYGGTIANDLSVIQTRENFTEETINTLQAGADDLTLADQNEEGANLLSLQTRQQLGTTSLSLASQSQQSVLRLF